MTEWRMQTPKAYLQGVVLIKAVFKELPTWDHEHCSFCWEKINQDNPRGYSTLDKQHWICEECYGDFMQLFGWKIDSNKCEW